MPDNEDLDSLWEAMLTATATTAYEDGLAQSIEHCPLTQAMLSRAYEDGYAAGSGMCSGYATGNGICCGGC